MSSLSTVSLTVCALLVVLALASGSASGPTTPPPPAHTLEEVNHRLDMILNNTRSRENYIRCFLDKGICNRDALSIKRVLADALATNCSNCTESQRLGAERFFQYLRSKQPDTWTSLTAKYDRSGAAKEDDDDESDDSDDDDDNKSGKDKHKHSHGNHSLPLKEGSPSQSVVTPTSVPGNSTITMIF